MQSISFASGGDPVSISLAFLLLLLVLLSEDLIIYHIHVIYHISYLKENINTITLVSCFINS